MSAAVARRPSLPDDLVPTILELNEDRWWPRDLQRLALVSPAWLGPVRRRLYAFPVVRSFRACNLLARTLKENHYLHPLLRGLDLRPLGDEASSELEMASLSFILNLQGVPKLMLGGELAIKAERFLHALTMPYHVAELHIDGNLLNLGYGRRSASTASLQWDQALASTFPNLRKLRLSNVELDIARPPVAQPLRLTELVLDDVQIVAGFLHHLADWRALRRLSVSCRAATDFDTHMRFMLAHCAESLQALHYEVQEEYRSDAVFIDDFLPCPAMTELSLTGVNMGADALATIGERCVALEQLSVQGRAVQTTSDEWISFIRSGALPSLRELATPYGTCAPPFLRWTTSMGKAVMAACSARNINLLCHRLRYQ